MILVQGFWLPRIKIIQFTGGFRPNFRDLTIILDTHLTFLTPKKEEYILSEGGDPPETVKLRRTLAVARFLCLTPFTSLGKAP